MILQVSGRSDICALYPKWLINRLKEGFVLVRNPYNEHLVSYVELSPDIVDCISFCTKDPKAIMPYLKEIDAMHYQYFFMVTITPYDIDLEPGLRPKLDIMKSFIELSKQLGKERVIWRYDPILLTERYNKKFHEEMFEKMARLLSPYTNTVIISFIDIYKNIVGKFNELSDSDIKELAHKFGIIANKYNLRIQTCSEKYHLEEYGITKGSCLNREYVEKLVGYSLNLKHNSNREYCGCLASVEIGAYSCCNHGCKYCYACNHQMVAKNMSLHDESSPMLIGHISNDDKIVKRKVASNKIRQIKFNI